jgi:hypothetical protein
MNEQGKTTQVEMNTKVMRYVDLDGKKRWLVFNHQGEQLRARPSHSKVQALGIFATKFPVHRPVVFFDGLARMSEMVATLCDYPDPKKQQETV